MSSKGPSPLLILATRLRHVDGIPYIGIMGEEHRCGYYEADFEGWDESANHPPQWASGEAFCLSCNHTWAGVAETGVEQLECPFCKRMTGHWKFEFAPHADTPIRHCNCGNTLFYLTKLGHMCASCGLYQAYD